MSVEAMAAVLHHSRAKGTAKLVLLGIANHEGDGGAWPTVNTLAKYANAHPRNVQRALAQLQSIGELKVLTQRGGLGGQPDETRPNLYRVQVYCPADCDGTAQHRTTASRRSHPLTLELDLGTTDQDRVAISPPGGTTATGPGGTTATGGVAPPPPKPSLEPPSQPPISPVVPQPQTARARPCGKHPGAGRRAGGECAGCWSDRVGRSDDQPEGMTA